MLLYQTLHWLEILTERELGVIVELVVATMKFQHAPKMSLNCFVQLLLVDNFAPYNYGPTSRIHHKFGEHSPYYEIYKISVVITRKTKKYLFLLLCILQ